MPLLEPRSEPILGLRFEFGPQQEFCYTKTMQSIQLTIQKRLNQHKLTPATQAALVVHFANEYFLKKRQGEAAQVQATMLKQSVLWVEVAHPILAQEVWGESLGLLESLREKFPEVKVSQIRTKALTGA